MAKRKNGNSPSHTKYTSERRWETNKKKKMEKQARIEEKQKAKKEKRKNEAA